MVHTRLRLFRTAAALAGVSLAAVCAVPSQAAVPAHNAMPGALPAAAETSDPAALAHVTAQAAALAAEHSGAAQRARLAGPLTGCGTLLTHVDATNTLRTVSIYDMGKSDTAGTVKLPIAPVAMTTIAASAPNPTTKVFSSVMIAADSKGHLSAVRLTRTLTGTGTTTATVNDIRPSIAGISEMYASGPYLYMRAGTQFVRWTLNSAYTAMTGGVQIGKGSWSSLRAIHGVVRSGTGTNVIDQARGINAATGMLADVKLYRRPTTAPVLLRYTKMGGFKGYTKLYSGGCQNSTAVGMYGITPTNAVDLYVDGKPLDVNASAVKRVGSLVTGLVGGRIFV